MPGSRNRYLRRLVLARDSMGIKMVYYRLTEDTVQFGSEIRAVVAAEETKPVVDPVALNLLLRYRFCPSPFTVYKGIRKLAPGTMLVIEEGKAQVRRWYNFKPEPFSPMPSARKRPTPLRPSVPTAACRNGRARGIGGRQRG